MAKLENDFLYLIFLLSDKKTSRGVYPHKKTIINIFKGNENSINAKKFKDTRFFGKYSFFNTIIFDDYISKYKKDYIREHKKNDKIRYYANKDLKHYIKDQLVYTEPNKSVNRNDEEITMIIKEFVK